MPVVKELADFIIVSVVPAIESFVAGLTGKDSLAEGLSESQIKAVEWGKKVRGIIDTVVDLKDELIVVGAIIATIFVTSKIAAAVQGTIVLITSLIKVYNLLKASAIVAGIASAFALNPLLGVGAVALAAAVLAGANALIGSDEKLPEFAVGGAPGAISGGGGGGGGGTKSVTTPNVISGGGGGGGGTTAAAKALSAAVAAATKSAVIDESKMVAGAFDTGLSGTQSLAAIEAASNRGFPFGTSGVNTNTLAGILAASKQPAVTINNNFNTPTDSEAVVRAMNNLQNDSFFRGTGGANNLVIQ